VAVLSMSKQEFSRLDVLLRVQSGRLRVTDACVRIGLQHRLEGLNIDPGAGMGELAEHRNSLSECGGLPVGWGATRVLVREFDRETLQFGL
jgi:hypothetical protein